MESNKSHPDFHPHHPHQHINVTVQVWSLFKSQYRLATLSQRGQKVLADHWLMPHFGLNDPYQQDQEGEKKTKRRLCVGSCPLRLCSKMPLLYGAQQRSEFSFPVDRHICNAVHARAHTQTHVKKSADGAETEPLPRHRSP